MSWKGFKSERDKATINSTAERLDGEIKRSCFYSTATVFDPDLYLVGHPHGRARTCYHSTVRIAFGHFVTAMDAIRVLDGKRVMIKKTRPQTTKATVVHILEIFPDTSTVESNVVFIVMPLLREFYDPPFDTVREGVDFMRQTLTGITFMHKSGVAHLECTAHNIMMDASQMYPNCFHPTRKSRNFDGISTAKCISRTKAKSVKYFFTDFEKSRVITSEGDRRMRRRQGARNLPPEIERGELYDPFPVDMYYLGNTNREHLLEKYTNMEFLRPLVVSLIQDDPKARPSAPEALAQFENIISSCKGCSLRRKGRRCDEGRWSKAIGDVWSVGQEVLPTAPKTARPLTIVLRSTIGTLRKRQPFVLPGN